MAEIPAHIDIKHETVHSHLVRDNIVDILGSLVPGMVFTTLMVPTIVIPPLIAVYQIPNFPAFPIYLGDFLYGPVTWEKLIFVIIPLIALWLLASYILGFIFFRQDPKIVDAMSANRIVRRAAGEDLFFEHKTNIERKFPYLRWKTKIPFIEYVPLHYAVNVEFPYIKIRSALRTRGLHYLSDKIPWDENNYSERARRTKHYANALKLRILMKCPEEYSILARNEAHVRLSSSMWFVSRSLRHFSLFGFDLYIGIGLILWIFLGVSLEFSILAWFPPIVIYLAAFWSSIAIENSFHYQRTREIMFILETAYWLEKTNKIPNLFDGIILAPVSAAASGSGAAAPLPPVAAAGSGSGTPPPSSPPVTAEGTG
jgi:hypothetical protein